MKTDIPFSSALPSCVGHVSFHHIIALGNLEAVELCITKGADPYLPSEEGDISLHIAAQYGHDSLVEYFHEKLLIPIGIQNKYGLTPLHMACDQGHTRIVRYLCNHHILSCLSLDIPDTDGKTPFYLAANKNHIDVLKILLRFGASPHQLLRNKVISFSPCVTEILSHYQAFESLAYAIGTVASLENKKVFPSLHHTCRLVYTHLIHIYDGNITLLEQDLGLSTITPITWDTLRPIVNNTAIAKQVLRYFSIPHGEQKVSTPTLRAHLKHSTKYPKSALDTISATRYTTLLRDIRS